MANTNKNKYFEVETTSIVWAPNMASARAAASGKRVAGTKVLSSSVDVERLPAAEAKALSA